MHNAKRLMKAFISLQRGRQLLSLKRLKRQTQILPGERIVPGKHGHHRVFIDLLACPKTAQDPFSSVG
jgi:hypothetical protein